MTHVYTKLVTMSNTKLWEIIMAIKKTESKEIDTNNDTLGSALDNMREEVLSGDEELKAIVETAEDAVAKARAMEKAVAETLQQQQAELTTAVEAVEATSVASTSGGGSSSGDDTHWGWYAAGMVGLGVAAYFGYQHFAGAGSEDIIIDNLDDAI